jgi:hypothetical protein
MSLKPDLLAAIFLLACEPPTEAHDIYLHLTDSRGRQCCDDRDCRPARYRFTAGGVEMFAYERWFAVPADRIQYRALPGDTGETDGGHWCGLAYQQRNGRVSHVTQCAILPPYAAERMNLPMTVSERSAKPGP